MVKPIPNKLLNQRISDAWRRSKRRGHYFPPPRDPGRKIYKEEFMMKKWVEQNGICALTGEKMAIETQRDDVASWDRIDSDGTYMEYKNVQWVCDWANKMKGNATKEEGLRRAKVFIEYQNRCK